MTANDDHFDEFEPHTLLKHAVLRAYLAAWSMKLMQGPTAESKVWFLDGFAGAGKDKKGNPGSPVIACQAALQIRSKPGESPRELGVFCIEKEREYYLELAPLIEGFRRDEHVDAHTRHGQFTEHCEDALRIIGGKPVLAFLDPFGIKGLSAELYRPLLKVRRSEIFMLVADAGAARLSGVLNADDRKFDAVAHRIGSAPSLFAEHDRDELASNEAARLRRAEHIARTRAGILRTLTEALGADAAAELEKLPTEEMSTRYVHLLEQRLREAGATHIVAFPVRDIEGIEKHLLLHACASEHGALAMKESIQAALNREELDEGMRQRLREDLTVDIPALVDACALQFAGQTLLLSKEERGSLQWQLLAGTRYFSFQKGELVAELKRRGFYLAKPKQTVMFPPLR